MKEDVKKEIDFCIKLREEEGGCTFGKSTRCEQCAALSVLRKLYSGEVLDGQKLSLEEWKQKIKNI
ncbi:MAG: hypothetical protein NT085_05280 [candidate division SR1 bacterium]|nr:hypothetical protein [candidate division SR1 bacterium]